MAINKPKIVVKPWGQEDWIADGSETPYALKRIFFKAGNRTSLQVHEFKCETNYVASGTGRLYYSDAPFDIKAFLKQGMTPGDVDEYEKNMCVVELTPGMSFTMLPGYVHRVVATTDLEFIEVSTVHLDDVYRLQDDQGRAHGKIQSEHDAA